MKAEVRDTPKPDKIWFKTNEEVPDLAEIRDVPFCQRSLNFYKGCNIATIN